MSNTTTIAWSGHSSVGYSPSRTPPDGYTVRDCPPPSWPVWIAVQVLAGIALQSLSHTPQNAPVQVA